MPRILPQRIGHLGAGWLFAPATLLLTVALAAPGTAGITLSRDYPTEGEAVEIIVTRADDTPAVGAPVTVTYRPGSTVSAEDSLGVTGADGRLAWMPENAGLVTLAAEIPAAPGGEAESVTTNLSVKFHGIPTRGILVLLAAGFIFYGGVIQGFRRMTRIPAGLPPDT